MSDKVKLVKGSVRVDFPESVDPFRLNLYDKLPREAFVRKMTVEYEIDPLRYRREEAAFWKRQEGNEKAKEKGVVK